MLWEYKHIVEGEVEMDKQTKILDPKLDVIFQALFGEEGSERITKAFLEKILEIKIQKIE